MKKFIISIDAGTTSNRSILFDIKGKPIFSSQKEFTQYFPKSGWVEHNPDEIWKTTIKTLKDVIKKAKRLKGKILSIGSSEAKVTVKVFSSLTCPHCANFHISIYENLKKDFIDKGLVKFEHHAFPLDLAALNAEIIVRCHINKDKKFKLLEKMYEKQKDWAIGSDINKINDSIKKNWGRIKFRRQKNE